MIGKLVGIMQDINDMKPIINIKLEKNSDVKTLLDIKNDRLNIEIKEYKEKRSLSANNYAWVLIGKLADKLNISSVEVYREYIKDLNVCKQMTLPRNDFKTFKTAWGMLGLGWVVEELDITDKDEIIANFHYGSSTYSTKQMSRLIDNIVQDCKELGIETLDETELLSMVKEWRASQERSIEMLKIKDSVDLKELEKFGFKQSHVSVFPKDIVRVANWKEKLIITICIEEPSYNMWSGKDWKDSRILKLWKCHRLENSTSKIWLEPEVKEHLCYECDRTVNQDIEKYIKDLIKADMVEKVE